VSVEGGREGRYACSRKTREEGREGGREGGRAGMLTFGGGKGHAGLGELGLELVEDGRAQAGRHVAGNALHHA